LERGYVKKEDIKGKEFICKEFELNCKEGELIKEIDVKREFGNEKGKLVIQPLGEIVMDFLNKHFNSLFDYEYTSLMELNLDKISNDQMMWTDVCAMCNKEVDELINCIQNEAKMVFKIDDSHTYMIGKYGPVIKCVDEKKKITFKSVNKNLDVTKIQNGEYKLEEMVSLSLDNQRLEPPTHNNEKPIFGKFEDKEVVLHKGKFGLYASWDNKTKTLKELGNRPIENITFEEVKNILDKIPSGSGIIREITRELSIRNGPKGDYLFYKNAKMKKPMFYDITSFCKEDYKICDVSILKSLAKNIIKTI
jgi:DNA topoisomerase-1